MRGLGACGRPEQVRRAMAPSLPDCGVVERTKAHSRAQAAGAGAAGGAPCAELGLSKGGRCRRLGLSQGRSKAIAAEVMGWERCGRPWLG
jgi:hypothetical protein